MEDDRTPEADETALERLRRRYAEGELTDEQFERTLETTGDTDYRGRAAGA